MSQNAQTISAASAGTIQLGDLTVNRLGFGAMRTTGKGIWGPPDDRNAALQTLRRVVELGVNFIDTADSYGPYVSEELIAEALAPYPAGLVIGTKAGWERVGPGQWIHNASPKHLQEAVEGSLKRLRLHQIDLLQLPVPDPRRPDQGQLSRSIEWVEEQVDAADLRSSDGSIPADRPFGVGLPVGEEGRRP